MKRTIATTLLLTSLAIVGCDSKENTSKQVDKAADKTAGQASDAMSKMKSTVNDGADKAKDMAKDNAAVAKEAADNNAAAAKEAAKTNADSAVANIDGIQKQIDDLISKAKSAVNDKKWDDAEGYLKQIKELETKLPQPVQDKINASMGDVQKMIDAGKQLMPGGAPAMPNK